MTRALARISRIWPQGPARKPCVRTGACARFRWSILGQIPMNVGAPMTQAISAVPYCTGLKVGLQFKRRFWEEDEQIYGGVTYTDLPIGQISYPSSRYFDSGKGVLLGAYIWDMINSWISRPCRPRTAYQRPWNMAVKFIRSIDRN